MEFNFLGRCSWMARELGYKHARSCNLRVDPLLARGTRVNFEGCARARLLAGNAVWTFASTQSILRACAFSFLYMNNVERFVTIRDSFVIDGGTNYWCGFCTSLWFSWLRFGIKFFFFTQVCMLHNFFPICCVLRRIQSEGSGGPSYDTVHQAVYFNNPETKAKILWTSNIRGSASMASMIENYFQLRIYQGDREAGINDDNTVKSGCRMVLGYMYTTEICSNFY